VFLRNHFGLFLAEIGDLPAALDQFRSALAVFRHHPDAHYNLAQTALLMNQPGLAESHFRSVLQYYPDPNNTLVYTGLANALGAQGKVDDGLAIHDDLLRRSRNPVLTLVGRIAYLIRFDRIEDAKAQLEEAEHRDPKEPMIAYMKGELAMKSGSKELALSQFEKALSLRPDWPDLVEQLARLKRDLRTSPEKK